MTRRLAVLAALIVAVLALGAGAVLAAAPRDGGNAAGHDRMHASEDMRAMHEQMPDDAQADCDRMHAQMRGMHAQMDEMHARGGHRAGNGPTMSGAMPSSLPSAR
jgi:hypothetical protein